MNADDEYYRQIAEYEQIVLPVRRAAKAATEPLFLELVGEEYRLREAKAIHQSWITTRGKRTGKQIRRYEDGRPFKSLKEGCVPGADKQSLKMLGGADTLQRLRARQREACIQTTFGAAEYQRQVDNKRATLFNQWLRHFEAGKAEFPNLRLYLARELSMSARIVAGSSLSEAVEYRKGQYMYAPQVGALLGNIDFFNKCWEAFHAAEQVIPATTTPVGVKKSLPSTFADYIVAEHREKLLPFLKQHYTNAQPKELTCMLFALNDLHLLAISFESNKEALHKSLQASFGNVGTRQGITTSINNFNRASEQQQSDIQRHRKNIKDYDKDLE